MINTLAVIGTDVVESGIATAGEVWGGFWTFATANPAIMVIFGVTLVGVGISLFFAVKSRLSGKRKKKGGR